MSCGACWFLSKGACAHLHRQPSPLPCSAGEFCSFCLRRPMPANAFRGFERCCSQRATVSPRCPARCPSVSSAFSHQLDHCNGTHHSPLRRGAKPMLFGVRRMRNWRKTHIQTCTHKWCWHVAHHPRTALVTPPAVGPDRTPNQQY